MGSSKFDYSRAVEPHFPGLIERIRTVIRDSENAHEGSAGTSDSFLWEHTTHVTSIAYHLAQAEEVEPLIPVVAALFHDAGKFAGGYHKEGTVEERESARVAEQLLREAGMKPTDIRRVVSGLNALYNEKAPKNPVAAILHDADFLSKFGALGVASFFIKSTLRGRALTSAVFGYLGKELTYAACLPLNMQTAAGRRLAEKKSRESLRFFRTLLSELRDAQIADLKIRRIHVPHPLHEGRFLEVQIVCSETCPSCGGAWHMAWATESGVKCQKLCVDWACGCGERLRTAFCLPEIISKGQRS